MNVFNKFMSFLIITSFMFCGEAFARTHKSEEHKRTVTVKRAATKTRPTPRRDVVKTRAKAIPTSKARAIAEKKRVEAAMRARAAARTKAGPTSKARAIEEKKRAAAAMRARAAVRAKARPAPIRTVERTKAAVRAKAKPTPISAAEKARATARAKAKPTPISAAEKARVAVRAKAQPAPITSTEKARATAKAKAQPTPMSAPEKARAATRAKAKPVPMRTTERAKAAARAKVKPAPVKEPRYYVIKSKDIPNDLRTQLSTLGFHMKKSEDKVTPSQLRKALASMEKLENLAPGITSKARSYLLASGYNPGSNARVKLYAANLPTVLKTFLEEIDLEDEWGEEKYDYNKKVVYYELTQAEATKLLDAIHQAETNIPGLTQKMRAFLKSKYGFQG